MEDLKFARLEDRVQLRTIPKESSLELDALPGTWLNTSSDNGGIGKVIITSQNSKLRLRVFGAAGPDLRDTGEMEAEHICSNNITSQDADPQGFRGQSCQRLSAEGPDLDIR